MRTEKTVQIHLLMLVCAVAMSIAFGTVARAEEPLREEVGPGARVYFTQCYDGDPTAEDFRRMADAGFSVVVRPTDIFEPLNNAASLEAMPTYFRMAAEAGLDAAIFQGGMATDEGLLGARRLCRDGQASPYLPASSAAEWQAMGDALVAWAKLSRTHRNFKFVGLDFEFYKGGGCTDFSESYDKDTFTGFFKSTGRTFPDPAPTPDKRFEYIQSSGLLDAYIAYERGRVLQEVRKVRGRIDEVNPRFQIGAYGWGSMFSAVLEGFATPKAPVIHLDPYTYGRGQWDVAYDKHPDGGYAGVKNRPDREGLKWSQTYAGKACRTSRLEGWPEVHLSGHWPQVTGPDDGSQYKFCVRQAFNSAAYGDGYWIWTEQFAPKPYTSMSEWTNAMVAYFKEANAALDAGDFTWASRQPDAVSDPKATEPLVVITFGENSARAWNPLTGEIAESEQDCSFHKSAVQPEPRHGEHTLRISGCAVEMVDAADKLVKLFPAGPGIRAVAVGDVDGIAGDEVITLGAGFVRTWDPGSGAELLRFRVGNDQTGLVVEPLYQPCKEAKP